MRKDGKEETNWETGAFQVCLGTDDIGFEQGPESEDGKKWRNQMMLWRRS